MPAIPQPPPLTTGTVVTKWHTTFETTLALCSITVFLFALLVLYVVTHMDASLTSELKATITAQRKELRKLRRNAVERTLLVKDGKGDMKGGDGGKGYGTLEDRKRMERLAKIRPYIVVPSEVGVGN